ncbi:protein ZW2 [Sesamum alatum]|uniref:Protein ZW2 n=1 Tax=Sesamum alatum TaxID=300844 RepID=A0AAE1YQI4_9LAMI|nr:protein ZW2 [Sesamum alatum]
MAANSTFTSFFHRWLSRQEAFLRQLETLDGINSRQECSEIIPRVFSHYQEFYREKSRAAHDDVFLLLSAPWLTSFERSMLWISGFRPSILFPIIGDSVAGELSAEQRQRIEAVKAETRRKEREITQAMARVQETVAEQPVYSLMRRFGKLVDGEVAEFDAAMEGLKAAMLVVVENADALQGWTAAEVVEILSPAQGVKFLAAVARFQLQARRWGVEKDSERERMAADAAFPPPA